MARAPSCLLSPSRRRTASAARPARKTDMSFAGPLEASKFDWPSAIGRKLRSRSLKLRLG